MAIGATLAFAGKPGGGGASTTLYPDLRTVVPAHLNLVNQQQNEYLRFSNGIANTGGGPWAMRPENSARNHSDDDARSRRSARRTRSTSAAGSAETGDPCYTSSRRRSSRSSSTTRRTTTGTRPMWRFSRFGGVARPGRSSARTRSRSASASSTCTSSTTTRQRARRRSGTATRATRASRSGWVDQYHQATDGQQVDLTGAANGDELLPRLYHEPDERVPRAGPDEQHRLGEVHARRRTRTGTAR